MSDPVTPSPPIPREPLVATLRRNLVIAAAVGAALAIQSHSLQRWLPASLLMLWPTLGGHYLELAFLSFIRPRLPQAPVLQVVARLLTWSAGGVLFAVAMHQTGRAIGDPYFANWPPLWVGALGMIGIELIAHASLRLRGKPNVYDTAYPGSRDPTSG